MARTDYVDITVSDADGVDFDSFFADYFAALEGGDNNFYGGLPDSAFGSEYYMNGSQVLTSYTVAGTDAAAAASVLIEGEELAYDFIHHGSSYGHGISGAIDSISFGDWVEDVTTGEQGTGVAGEVEGLDLALTISDLDLSVDPGAGSDPETNPVQAVYSAASAGDASAFAELLSGYSLFFTGAAGDDRFKGGDLQDRAEGGAGDDALRGGDAKDRLFGEDGNDILRGNAWRDRLEGGAGDDSLYGGKGADRLFGGDGDDWMKGGRGPDRFDFREGSGDDLVVDFDLAEGDRMIVSEQSFGDFEALSEVMEDGVDGVVVTLGLDHSVTLQGVTVAELDADAFGFH